MCYKALYRLRPHPLDHSSNSSACGLGHSLGQNQCEFKMKRNLLLHPKSPHWFCYFKIISPPECYFPCSFWGMSPNSVASFAISVLTVIKGMFLRPLSQAPVSDTISDGVQPGVQKEYCFKKRKFNVENYFHRWWNLEEQKWEDITLRLIHSARSNLYWVLFFFFPLVVSERLSTQINLSRGGSALEHWPERKLIWFNSLESEIEEQVADA